MSAAKSAYGALLDLTPVGDANRSVDAFANGRPMVGLAYGTLAVAGSLPGGEGFIGGSRAAVRAGLGGLGLSDDVARGVRGVLGSGAGQEWGVQALESGGAMVYRFNKGTNTVSSAIYMYLVNAAGKVEDIGKQAYDAGGAIAGTLKNKRP